MVPWSAPITLSPSTGPPVPPTFAGRQWLTVAELRSAIASGQSFRDSPSMFAALEQYERVRLRFERATRKHGFRRVVAKPRHDRALWCPYF